MDAGGARLITLFEAGVEAVQPEPLVLEWMSGNDMQPTHIIAIGKAAAGMARGAVEASPDAACLIATNFTSGAPTHARLFASSHPLPDAVGVAAGQAALEMAAGLGSGDRLLVLLSGGASSMAEAPAPGVDIGDLVEMNRLLLGSGAGIADVNAIRVAASRLKGGGLAAVAAPAEVTVLVISDVVGNDVATIGSGPTVGGDRAPAHVAARLGLDHALPASVRHAIATYAPIAADAEIHVLADGETAARAVVAAARSDGMEARIGSATLAGEAAVEGRRLVEATEDGGLTVHAGETTVTLSPCHGTGGRNQEAALAVAIAIDGREDIRFLAAGTDGIDGTTEAAGAVVDGASASRMRESGVDPGAALESHDSGSAHAAAGTAVVSGPTGTNVGDLWLIERSETRR